MYVFDSFSGKQTGGMDILYPIIYKLKLFFYLNNNNGSSLNANKICTKEKGQLLIFEHKLQSLWDPKLEVVRHGFKLHKVEFMAAYE